MKLWNKFIFFSRAGLCFLAALSVFFVLKWASADTLNGPSFSDPSQKMKMPDEWTGKPIQHDPSLGSADLVVTLDQQMYPAFSSLIEEYARDHDKRIVVHNGTCGISSGKLSRKEVDIGGFCCPPGLTDRLPGLEFHTIGITALALIVHPDNPVEDISLDQAREVFQNTIYRWSEIRSGDGAGGASTPIHPVARLHCKLRPGHWRLILDDEDLFGAGITEVGAIPDMIYHVSSNKSAIGYETLWMVRRFQDRGAVKTLKINGYDPSKPSDLLTGRYPLYRVYSLAIWNGKGTAKPLARKLVEYIARQSEHLDRKFGLIPASHLRKAGWKFAGGELVGEPE